MAKDEMRLFGGELDGLQLVLGDDTTEFPVSITFEMAMSEGKNDGEVVETKLVRYMVVDYITDEQTGGLTAAYIDWPLTDPKLDLQISKQ